MAGQAVRARATAEPVDAGEAIRGRCPAGQSPLHRLPVKPPVRLSVLAL